MCGAGVHKRQDIADRKELYKYKCTATSWLLHRLLVSPAGVAGCERI